MDPSEATHQPISAVPEDSFCVTLHDSLSERGCHFQRSRDANLDSPFKTLSSEISRGTQIRYPVTTEKLSCGSIIKTRPKPIYASNLSSSPSSSADVDALTADHIRTRVIPRPPNKPSKRVNLDADREMWSTIPHRNRPGKKSDSATSNRVTMSGRFKLPAAVLGSGRTLTSSSMSYKPPPKKAKADGDEHGVGKWHITMISSNDFPERLDSR